MRTSEDLKEIAAALSKAQGQIEGAKKDSVNPHLRSKYADLTSVWEACRAALVANGLSVTQTVEGGPDTLTVCTRLMHASGQWIEGELTMKPTKSDPQGMGSVATYGRRYGLAAIVGVAPDDDDAEAASTPQPAPAQRQKPAAVPQQEDRVVENPKDTCRKNALAITNLLKENGWGQKEFQEITGQESIEALKQAGTLAAAELLGRCYLLLQNANQSVAEFKKEGAA